MSNKTEILHKEIDLLQSCINRMANNSFLIKGWAITIISLILTLGKDAPNIQFILILASIAFLWLDARYLNLERAYRKQYEWVIRNRLNTDESLYELNPSNFQDKECICCTIFSETLLIFYIGLISCSLLISCIF